VERRACSIAGTTLSARNRWFGDLLVLELSSKRVAIVQSNYIPWKGYFGLIGAVDEFVLLDDAQFTKRDWRNRNKILTANGPMWLSIPVVTKGKYEQSIDETEIAEPWVEQHWSSIRHNYARAAHFEEMAPTIRKLYDAVALETKLSCVNYLMTSGICSILGIKTKISRSRDYPVQGFKTDRLLSICVAARATHYLSGPAAASYLEIDKFTAAGMTVSYADYSGYPVYPQLHEPFEHGVSILDLLFNTGTAAPTFMTSVHA
jgi:WbqC-like protein family